MKPTEILVRTGPDRYLPFMVWARDQEAAVICAKVHLMFRYKLEAY